MEIFLSAIIPSIFSILAIIVTAVFNNKKITQELKASSELSDSKLDDKLDKYSELTDMKIKQLAETTNIQIKQLTAETRIHNNFAQKIPVLEQRLFTAENRIDKVERELHNE